MHVIIPCRRYEQSFDRVSDIAGYRLLLSAARWVEVLDHDQPSEVAYLDAGHRVVDFTDVLLAVWDGLPAQGLGGTADVVEYARAKGKEITIIWPAGVKR